MKAAALALIALCGCNAGTQVGAGAPSGAVVRAETEAPAVLVILSSRNATGQVRMSQLA